MKPKHARANWDIRRDAAIGAPAEIPTAAVAPWDGTLAFSLWRGRKAKTTRSPRMEMTLPELEKWLDSHRRKIVDKRSSVALAAVSSDGRRLDASFAETRMLMLDCDGAGDWTQLRAALAGVGASYILQRSTSHTPEKPKWHLLVPLARPVRLSRDEWYSAYAHAIGVLESVGGLSAPHSTPPGAGFDQSCELRMALSFVPARRNAETPAPELVVANTGAALDLDAFLKATGFDPERRAREREAAAQDNRERRESAAKKAGERAAARVAALASGIRAPGATWPAACVTRLIEFANWRCRLAQAGARNTSAFNMALLLGGAEGGGAFAEVGLSPLAIREDLITSSFAAGGHELAHVREVIERAWALGIAEPLTPPPPTADTFEPVTPDKLDAIVSSMVKARERVLVADPDQDQVGLERVWITDNPADARQVAEILHHRVIALTDAHDAHVAAVRVLTLEPGCEVVVALDADPRMSAAVRRSRVALLERLANGGFKPFTADWKRPGTLLTALGAGQTPALRAVLRQGPVPKIEKPPAGSPSFAGPKALPRLAREVFLRAAVFAETKSAAGALRRASTCAVATARVECSKCGKLGCECVLVCELACCPVCSVTRSLVVQSWLAGARPDRTFVAQVKCGPSPEDARAARKRLQAALSKTDVTCVRWVLGPGIVVVEGLEKDADTLKAAIGCGEILTRLAAAEAVTLPLRLRIDLINGYVEREDSIQLASDRWVSDVVSTSCTEEARELLPWAPNDEIRDAASEDAADRRAEEGGQGAVAPAEDTSPCCRVPWTHVLLVDGREVASRKGGKAWSHVEALSVILQDWARHQGRSRAVG